MATLVLRCFARKDGDVFVAMCVDLSLAAQANTMEEAKGKLHAQITSYIKEAITSEYKRELLSRKAPIGIFIEYYKVVALCKLGEFFTKVLSKPNKAEIESFSEQRPVAAC